MSIEGTLPHPSTSYADPDDVEATPPAEPEDAPERRQPGELVRVWLDTGDDENPEVLEVRLTNRERIHWERVRHQRGWPAMKDAHNLAMTFCTWSAANRAGLTRLKSEQWEAALLDYDVLKQTPADPTRPTASPDAT